jgi:hypothetical protein
MHALTRAGRSVDLGQLRTVLEKYRDPTSGFGLLPGRSSAAGPSRKKEVDVALKKLRELARE